MIRTQTDIVNGRETVTAIWLVRGDDERIDVPLYVARNDELVPYEMQPGDTMTLTVRNEPDADSPILLQITSAPGQTVIPIRHADTKNLPLGRYSADIQLFTADGLRKTVWPDFEAGSSNRWRVRNTRNFYLVSEVTML